MNAPQEHLHHSAPILTATTTKNRPSHQNLPISLAAQFMKIFIPLLCLYSGTLENPWVLPDRFVDKLQELWDHVMLDWPHWFDEDDNVYCLVGIWTGHLITSLTLLYDHLMVKSRIIFSACRRFMNGVRI